MKSTFRLHKTEIVDCLFDILSVGKNLSLCVANIYLWSFHKHIQLFDRGIAEISEQNLETEPGQENYKIKLSQLTDGNKRRLLAFS